MSENWGRIFGGFLVLAILWSVVYWWWEPTQPRISFDSGDAPGALVSGGSASPPAPLPATVRDPTLDPVPPPRVESPPPDSAPETPTVAVIPPRFRPYTVRRGDTLESIARAELGSARYAEAISRSNPMVNFEGIRAGREIQIPLDPGNIQGKPVAETPPAAPKLPPEQAIEYTVRSGDTLSGIAKAQYGSTAYKDLIFEANRDRLADEDALKLGQKLRLPPKPR